MSSTTAISVANVSQLSAENLSHVIDNLSDKEKIVITRKNGIVQISVSGITGGKQFTRRVEQGIIRSLNPMPVAPGWMSHIEEPTERDTLRQKEKKSETNKAVRAHHDENEMMFSMLQMEISSLNDDDSFLVKSNMTEYRVFTTGNFQVYTLVSNRYPVMYKIGERGDLVYRVPKKDQPSKKVVPGILI